MKREVLTSIVVAILLAKPAVAQMPPTDQRTIPPRSIQLSAQEDHVIKENIKDMHLEQVTPKTEIKIGDDGYLIA